MINIGVHRIYIKELDIFVCRRAVYKKDGGGQYYIKNTRPKWIFTRINEEKYKIEKC